jgi:carbon storage regulator
MLVLSRKIGEKLVIGDNITVVVSKIAGNRVTLGIEAPGDVRIVRGELEPHAKAELATRMTRTSDERIPVPSLAK